MADNDAIASAEAAETREQKSDTTPAGDSTEQPAKKPRGKPKDPDAPPKPRSGYTQFAMKAREELKTSRPELISDLSAMGKAIAEEWAKVPQEEKDKLQETYEAEMKIWKPKWAVYKETDKYKAFFELKSDYLDKKAGKKLQKTMNKDAPKRPKSGYMIFGSEIREEITESVKKDGLGMGEIGKRISERWQELSEDKKAYYAEQSQQQKAVFDVEFMTYRKTDGFKQYMDAKAKLESKQQLKKAIRTHMDSAPKKAPSAYALFRQEVMPTIVEENDTKKEGEKLSVGQIGQKVASMWTEVETEKKQKLQAEADKLKAEYDKKLKTFKANERYTQFLEKRAKIKSRENLLVNLRDMPKRPKSVFALFAEEKKDAVEPGKGEGKGRSALKVLWGNTPEEEKEKYLSKEKELKEKWTSEVQEFKESDKYKTFEVTKNKVMQEFKNEAMKVTTMKFLSESPAPPPKSAFAFFLSEKRKHDTSEGERKSKAAKVEEVLEAKKSWMQLDKVVRDEYELKRKEEHKGYTDRVREFMATERWQAYQKEAKRLKIPVKSLLFHKKKMIKKLKKGMMPQPSSIPLPQKPEMFPSRPNNALQIFTAEKRGEVDTLEKVHEMWQNLSEDDRQKYSSMAEQSSKDYDEAILAYKGTDEGKQYYKEYKSAIRRRKILGAKNKYLGDMPKKPRAAVVAWMKENVSAVKKANPDAKGFDLKRMMEQKWTALDPELKQPYEEQAKAKYQEFEEAMSAFKSSDNWRNFIRAVKARPKAKGKGKAKAKGKSGPSVPARPEEMPKKPLGAFQAFCKEHAQEGKTLKDLQDMFVNLDVEERSRLIEESNAREVKYREEMAEFDKSAVGKSYNKQLVASIKKRRLMVARERFLKDAPKKPPSSYSLFVSAMRPKVQADYPDIRGLGPTMTKLGELWSNLDAGEKQVWLDKENEQKEHYEAQLAEFHKSVNYKKYQLLVNKLMGKSAQGKGKGKAKSRIEGPPKPANLPKKPPTSFFLFASEQRSSGGPSGLKAVNEAWVNLGAEGQKEFQARANELQTKYEADFKEFQKSAEGKRYLREKAKADQKIRMAKAKDKYLNKSEIKEPKKPPSAYFIFVQEKRSTVEASKVSEAARQLTVMWSELQPDEKRVYEEKADELKAQYEKEMEQFKSSKSYKMYARALDTITGKKAKEARAKAKAAAKGKGRGAAKAAPTKAVSDSDSDAMGSDSDSSSDQSDSSDSD